MSIPQNWRLGPIRLTLIGEKCGHCGAKIFPPRDLCPKCQQGVLPEGINLAKEIREGRTPPPKIFYGSKERGF
ncbi:MAG: zinc ribbon domain-containing protein [Microgenomates group bacterium]